MGGLEFSMLFHDLLPVWTASDVIVSPKSLLLLRIAALPRSPSRMDCKQRDCLSEESLAPPNCSSSTISFPYGLQATWLSLRRVSCSSELQLFHDLLPVWTASDVIVSPKSLLLLRIAALPRSPSRMDCKRRDCLSEESLAPPNCSSSTISFPYGLQATWLSLRRVSCSSELQLFHNLLPVWTASDVIVSPKSLLLLRIAALPRSPSRMDCKRRDCLSEESLAPPNFSSSTISFPYGLQATWLSLRRVSCSSELQLFHDLLPVWTASDVIVSPKSLLLLRIAALPRSPSRMDCKRRDCLSEESLAPPKCSSSTISFPYGLQATWLSLRRVSCSSELQLFHDLLPVWTASDVIVSPKSLLLLRIAALPRSPSCMDWKRLDCLSEESLAPPNCSSSTISFPYGLQATWLSLRRVSCSSELQLFHDLLPVWTASDVIVSPKSLLLLRIAALPRSPSRMDCKRRDCLSEESLAPPNCSSSTISFPYGLQATWLSLRRVSCSSELQLFHDLLPVWTASDVIVSPKSLLLLRIAALSESGIQTKQSRSIPTHPCHVLSQHPHSRFHFRQTAQQKEMALKLGSFPLYGPKTILFAIW